MNSSWALVLFFVLAISALGCFRSYRRVRELRSALTEAPSTEAAKSDSYQRLKWLDRLILRLLPAKAGQRGAPDPMASVPSENLIPSLKGSERPPERDGKESQTLPPSPSPPSEMSEFEALLYKEFILTSDETPSAVPTAVKTLAEYALQSAKVVGGELLPNENVQFTVYRPKTLVPETWQTLLAFAHLAEAPVDGRKEKIDPTRGSEGAGRGHPRQIGGSVSKTRPGHAQPIPREGELCFAPEADGIEFNPPRRTFAWRESVHLEVFLVRAPAALAGLTIRGRLSVFLGNLLIGEVPLNFSCRHIRR